MKSGTVVVLILIVAGLGCAYATWLGMSRANQEAYDEASAQPAAAETP